MTLPRFSLAALAFMPALLVSSALSQAPADAPAQPPRMQMDGSGKSWARPMLEASPRHREYVSITHDGRTVNTLIVYPEVKGKAPVIVLIHEIFGESDWFKLMADELAAKGYIVLAPDLASGVGPGDGGTDALTTQGGQDAVIKAVTSLPDAQVNADLNAVADYGKKLPSAGAKLFVAGFCWGGGKSFAFATHRQDLSAAFVFYGPPPPAVDMAHITAPVYGFYAGNDSRIDATIPQAVTDMKAAGRTFEPVTYDGAGHGFMRAGQAPDTTPANKKAFDEGLARLLKQLKANSLGSARATARPHRAGTAVAMVATTTPKVECAAMHGSM